jgi:hypothetical protein
LPNGPSTSPSTWYSCAMHAIPPCPPIVMTTHLFALGRRPCPSSLRMFCVLYCTSYNISLHRFSTHLCPLSNALTIALALFRCLRR